MTYPDTRNARSTCAFGAMMAEYAVGSTALEASTVASRTAFGIRSSVSPPARPTQLHVRTQAMVTEGRAVGNAPVFIGLCPWPFQSRPAPLRDPSRPAYSGGSRPQDSPG